MKFIQEIPLLGRKEKPLLYGVAGSQVALTPRLLVTEVLLGGMPRDKNTMANTRRLNKILDAVEEQEQGEYLAIGDDDWTFVRELVETAVLGLYTLHAPFIMDQLDSLINRGKEPVIQEAEEIIKQVEQQIAKDAH